MKYEKSLEAKFPNLAKEWHPTKNGELTPAMVYTQSNNRYWWKCSKCGHEWDAVLRNRTRLESGCPVCAGQQVHAGINDLATVNADLANEWHSTRNGSLTPQMVTAGSGKKVWWRCPVCGDEWRAEISHRNTGDGCPVCTGRKVLIGFNDFASIHPEKAVEWHPTKNGDLTPQMFTAGSEKKVWWKCSECGHEWFARINVVATSKGCPECSLSSVRKTSFPEQAIFFYLKKVCVVENRYLFDNEIELDIWLPESRIGIEYDGERWHPDMEEDLRKSLFCEAKNIRMLRIREPGCPPISGECIVLESLREKSLELAIEELLRILGFDSDVNFNRDRIAIYEQYLVPRGKDCLAVKNPLLSKEWHPTKNGSLTPVMFSPKSDKKVWWLCSRCGHEWQATISNRANGTSCRKCSRKKSDPHMEHSHFKPIM